MLQLKTTNGNVTDNPMEIETSLVNHFKQSYEGSVSGDLDSILEEITPLPVPRLFDQQHALLNKLVTSEEIESIFF